MQNPKFFRGFTLIELLVVIAIIAILAALVLNTAGFIQKKGARARAEAEIAALSAALESYKADNGDYPSNSAADPDTTGVPNTAGNSLIMTNLSPKVANEKVYFEFSKNMTNATTILDPFGEAYGYRYPGKKNGSNFFDLWSRGGSSITNQWIGNW